MQKLTCRVPLGTPRRLDHAIAQSEEARAGNLSRTQIRKLLVAGAVYVNGKRVRVASRTVHGGEIVDIYWDKTRSPERVSPESELGKFLPLRVLYRDEAIICFDKPAGLPTQPTLDEARLNLFQLAKRQLAEETGKPVYLGMHHRLDRDTSGVVLFTCEPKHNTLVGAQFKGHRCAKVYVAVVHGLLKNPKGRLESFLGPVERTGKRARFGSVRSGGKKAITEYLVLGHDAGQTLVEVRITTGRTHQIRVHLSEMGHPIVGDTLYGSAPEHHRKHGRFLLHAHSLSIEHPFTHNVILIESPIPQEFRCPRRR